jgi:Mannosylglycerate hydrolase MGH1-like glycoside hydrolase domain
VEHLMDRKEFFFHLGVPSTSFETADFDSDRYWRGSIWINMHWLLAQGLMNYGYFDIASKIFDKSHQLVAKEGYWEYYNPFNGNGLGASHFSWSTLTETMKPLEPPAELREQVLVLSPGQADANDELRTLYRHPQNRARSLKQEDITSVPAVFVNEVLQAIRQRPLTALLPISEKQVPRRLKQVADIIHHLIQERRDAWPEYPRICDLACLAGQEVFSGLGYRCQIRWTPDLHYFLLVKSRKGRPWIVDLSPSQFSWHPISRIPLLLERASLAIEDGFKRKGEPPLKLELLLRETQYAVHANWVQLERNRMDRHERNAFLHGCRRHRSLVRRLTERMPLHLTFLQHYLHWLDGIAHGASRRRE